MFLSEIQAMKDIFKNPKISQFLIVLVASFQISNPDSVRVNVVISILHLTHSLFEIAEFKSVI